MIQIFIDFIKIIQGEHDDFDNNFNNNCKVEPYILCDSAAKQ